MSRAIEAALEPRLAAGRRVGFFTDCSTVFKTPHEVLVGRPLLLDMVDDARVSYDRDGFFAGALERVRTGWRGSAPGGSGSGSPQAVTAGQSPAATYPVRPSLR